MFFRALLHPVRVLQAKRREKKKERERSPHWATTRKHWLEKHPACAACGSKKNPQVHHKVPFSNSPQDELNPENLITLCMSLRECHEFIGHGGGWTFYNPNVATDAAECLADPKKRKDIEKRAKATRLT